MVRFHSALRYLRWLCLLVAPHAGAVPRPPVLPQCTGITLQAAYLAQVSPGEGPGFLLVITNHTDAPVMLARPFPTSAHWYAQAPGGRWLWRASTGAGGALVNALNERGPVFASPASPAPTPGLSFIVAPHAHVDTAESIRDNPVLRFRPGCDRCRNPEDTQYRAVLAYAYAAPPTETAVAWLPCGLRSNLVVMPPLD